MKYLSYQKIYLSLAALLFLLPPTSPFSIPYVSLSQHRLSSSSQDLCFQSQNSLFHTTFPSCFFATRSIYPRSLIERRAYTEENGDEKEEDDSKGMNEGMKMGNNRSAKRQKKHLTWQEAIEAIITPTTSNSQRSILLK